MVTFCRGKRVVFGTQDPGQNSGYLLDVTPGSLLQIRGLHAKSVKRGFNPLHTAVERLKWANKGQFKITGTLEIFQFWGSLFITRTWSWVEELLSINTLALSPRKHKLLHSRLHIEHVQETAELSAHLAWPGLFWRGCAEKWTPWGRSRLQWKRGTWEPENLGWSLSSAMYKLGSLKQSTSPQWVSVYAPVKWPDETPCKTASYEPTSQALSNTTSGVTLGYSRSLLTGVSSTAFWEAHLQALGQRERSPSQGVTAPPLPSLSHPKLLSQSGGPKVASRGSACPSLSSKPFSVWQNPAGS